MDRRSWLKIYGSLNRVTALGIATKADAMVCAKTDCSRLRTLVLLLVILCCAQSGYAQYPPADFSRNPFLLVVPVDLAVPKPPAAFQGTDRKFHLVYELHITNFSKVDLVLRQLDVLDDSSGSALASYSGKELRGRLQNLAGRTVNQTLSSGTEAVVFIWLDFADVTNTQRLRHRLEVAAPAFSRFGLQTVEGGSTQVTGEARVIGPPLRGGEWWAALGPSNRSGHRRTLIAVDGKARIPERYATDWAKEQNGEILKGDPSRNSSYFGYGAEVLAVADGTVVSVLDGLPENRPEGQSYPVPMNLKNVGGNNIVLDIGQQQFAFYAHLQPHTIRVHTGDHVVRGQVLALIGNSGNATGPHLHFQLSDTNSELGTEGLPFVIDSVELIGNASGEKISLLPRPEVLNRVLPLEDDIVRFP